jgi:hypothetical protein
MLGICIVRFLRSMSLLQCLWYPVRHVTSLCTCGCREQLETGQ